MLHKMCHTQNHPINQWFASCSNVQKNRILLRRRRQREGQCQKLQSLNICLKRFFKVISNFQLCISNIPFIQESPSITIQTVVVSWPWFYVYVCHSFLNWWGICCLYKDSILWLRNEYCLLIITHAKTTIKYLIKPRKRS